VCELSKLYSHCVALHPHCRAMWRQLSVRHMNRLGQVTARLVGLLPCWQVLETLPFSALLAVFALVYLASILWLGTLVYIAELPTPASRLPSLPTPEGLLSSLLQPRLSFSPCGIAGSRNVSPPCLV